MDEEKKREGGRDLYEWVQALVCSVLAVVVVFTFVIRLIGGPHPAGWRPAAGAQFHAVP